MDDLVRSKEKSSPEKEERQEEFELEKESAKFKEKRASRAQVEAETSLIAETVKPVESVIDISPLGAVGGEIVRCNSNSIVPAFDDKGSEEEEEYFDPLGAVKSPTKKNYGGKDSLVVTLTRRRSQEGPGDNWSIKFNKFFPSDCVVSPPPCLSPSSPRFHGYLNQLGEGQEAFIEVFEDEGGIDTNISTEVHSIEHYPSNMDANVYKARLKEVKKAFAKVDRRIKYLRPDNITLQDKETYKDYLEETRKLLDEAQDAAFELCSDLDITTEDDGRRIQEINLLESKSSQDCIDNAHDIKNKILELIASVPANDNGTNSATNSEAPSLQLMQREAEKEARLATEKIIKIELRMKNVTKKSNDLVQKIRNILDKDCQDMTDQEIRENLLNSKDWEKQIDNLTTSKEAIELDSVGVSVNEDIKNTFETDLHDAIDKVCTLIENLKLVDKEKALHTLAPSKVKENIVYPKPFSGKSGENVFKFVKDFKDAIAADQVREVDKVKKLMFLLRDNAKKAVGEHYKDLKDALDELERSFGNEEIIWDKILADIKEKLGDYKKWGKGLSRERLTAYLCFFTSSAKPSILLKITQNLRRRFIVARPCPLSTVSFLLNVTRNL